MLPSGFFFGLEKKRGQRKIIHALHSDTGQELREPDQIRNRAVQFFFSLYSSEYEENTEKQSFVQSCHRYWRALMVS